MTTGYTRDQLRHFEILIAQNVPPEQTAEQLEGAPVVADIWVNATDKGALVRLGFSHGAVHAFFLNCVVARTWTIGLEDAAREQGWSSVEGRPRADADRATPTDEEVWDAFKVLSLRTDSTPDGALVSFGSGRTVSQFFVPRRCVDDIVAAMRDVAARAGWWDAGMQLVPANR